MNETARRVLLTNAIVHTPGDPGATAILVEDDKIGWIGHAGAALAHADGVDRLIDVKGALITPAFVDSHVQRELAATLPMWASAGIAAVAQMAPAERQGGGVVGEILMLSGPGPGWSDVTLTPSGGEFSPRVYPYQGQWSERSAVAAHVLECVERKLQGGFGVENPDDLSTVLAGLATAAESVGLDQIMFGRHRLELSTAPQQTQIREMVRLGVTASIRPLTSNLPLADLAAAGIPMAFGSGAPDNSQSLWANVRAAVQHDNPQQALTARAAFAAHTRGGWRAVGRDDSGVLMPGTSADLAVWECESLAVQEPDDRVSRWSTDPRSGTPLLPELGEDINLPRCLMTMIAGEVAFDGGAPE